MFTKGNRDVTGPGAAQVYDKVLVPSMAEQTDKEIRQAALTREREGVLLFFYDAYNRDSLEWFNQLLQKQKPKRLLFVIHPPVVPYNAVRPGTSTLNPSRNVSGNSCWNCLVQSEPLF